MRIILLLICLLFAYGYHLIAGWYPNVSWIQGSFMSDVWPAFVAFLSVVFILFFSLNKKSDPVLGSWGVMALIGCMLVVPLIVAREHQARSDLVASEELKASKEAIRLQRLREADRIKEEIADRQERGKTDRFVQYEGRIPAGILNQMRELDLAMMEEVKSQADMYKQAMDANPTLGPDAWVRFRRIDQLSLEIAKHRELYEQTRAFSQFVETFEDRYTKKIEELALQPPADRIAIAELECILQEWERTKLYELRRLDVKLLGSAIKALNILSDEWGSWIYEPREKNISIENKSQEADFGEAIMIIKAILEEVRMISDDSEPED